MGRAGIVNLSNFFDTSEFANNEARQFLGSAFVNSAGFKSGISAPGFMGEYHRKAEREWLDGIVFRAGYAVSRTERAYLGRRDRTADDAARAAGQVPVWGNDRQRFASRRGAGIPCRVRPVAFAEPWRLRVLCLEQLGSRITRAWPGQAILQRRGPVEVRG